jgi:hypothetical protein
MVKKSSVVRTEGFDEIRERFKKSRIRPVDESSVGGFDAYRCLSEWVVGIMRLSGRL